MPVKRLPLLELGGEDAFPDYEAAFDRIYRAGPVVDVLGNLVEFPPGACRHVCFKPPEADPYGRLPREVWSQERAERIPWIDVALSDPGTEVRPNIARPDRLSYFLTVEADPARGLPVEYYGIVAEPQGPGLMTFITGFPLGDHATFARWRRAGARLYPPPAPPKPKRGRR